MTAQQHPGSSAPGHPADEQPRRTGKLVGAVLSGTVLVVGNAATLYFTVIAWLMMPAGPGDSNHITARWIYIDAVYPEPPDRYRYGSGQLPVPVVDASTPVR